MFAFLFISFVRYVSWVCIKDDYIFQSPEREGSNEIFVLNT